MMSYLFIYFLIMSSITFFLMYIDKQRAIKKEWRIPEINLMALSFLGGSFGTYLGMYFFRHKTKHIKFTLGVPVAIFFNLIIYFYLINLI
ncbi:DUF1294 domain-containing protein [Paeniclostridium sordellii]|nr:DUF1294 domain-containing protein [Paeniclostridium sordellii]MCH1965827.1 DUF1294 domain-containing protein [Paeniclostridium sordellii]MCQ4696401.1 DUF1294 domain-containing protein [Paeniclostridium sordellii]MDU6480433.1 DUF1294 domain-containing protein [Paeniclostridium sordellii]TAN64943.1 DUF1294 domain-containing protein [Paeniclostridium sordellii 8483]